MYNIEIVAVASSVHNDRYISHITRTGGGIENYDGPVLGLYERFDEAKQHTIDGHTGDDASIAARICEGLDEGKFVVR